MPSEPTIHPSARGVPSVAAKKSAGSSAVTTSGSRRSFTGKAGDGESGNGTGAGRGRGRARRPSRGRGKGRGSAHRHTRRGLHPSLPALVFDGLAQELVERDAGLVADERAD